MIFETIQLQYQIEENEILVLRNKIEEQKQTIDNQSFLIESLRKDSLKLLEKDKGYHIRIQGDEPSILFGDLDNNPR